MSSSLTHTHDAQTNGKQQRPAPACVCIFHLGEELVEELCQSQSISLIHQWLREGIPTAAEAIATLVASHCRGEVGPFGLRVVGNYSPGGRSSEEDEDTDGKIRVGVILGYVPTPDETPPMARG